jgi:hypothetical protein
MLVCWVVSAFLAVAAHASSFLSFTPTRVSFQSLHGHSNCAEGDAFWSALRDVGLVSITDVPSSWNKQTLFEELERCMSQPSIAAPLHVFPDGTRRRTLATYTLAGHAEPLFTNNNEDEEDCRVRLEEQSQTFRRMVDQVTAAVADRLGRLLGHKLESGDLYLLESADKDQHYTIDQVIQQGEHLEHFHCYYKDDSDDATTSATIDWHTDQGLLIVFAPGQRKGEATDGFYIQLKDGSAVELKFDMERDDLIVMLGDGVNQYVNPKLPSEESKLRAAPHTLKMTNREHENNPKQLMVAPRLWYGRMVLPPPPAVHPQTSMTFQDMRSSMIDGDSAVLSLGCAPITRLLENLRTELTEATMTWKKTSFAATLLVPFAGINA